MSFALTTEQMRKRRKTVTRRLGWWDLEPGELVCAVEKSQGLRKGEKVRRITVIRILNTRAEALDRIDAWDVEREGFPGMSPARFIDEFCRSHKGCKPHTVINRIEFEFVGAEARS